MFCKSCGTYMEDSYNVCQNCGTRKGEGTAFCDGCGSIRQVGTAFCPECGNKFIDVPSSTAPSSVPYSQQTAAQQFRSQAQMNNSQYLPEKKFCRNCGVQVMNNQIVCTSCGTKVGEGSSYCPHCAQPVQPGAEVCMSCGKSLKTGFDIGAQLKGYADNFSVPFKSITKLDTILEYGAIFMSVLTFILSLIPSVYVYVEVWGFSQSVSMNVFESNWVSGVCFILALLAGAAYFVPYVQDFIRNNQKLGKYAILVVPGLMLIGTILLTISVLNGAGAAAEISYANASCGYNFWGWLLIIFVLASVAASVLSYLKKENIVKF